MNEEFQFKNWGYKDLGMLGAYIVEKNNESYKQIDVTNVKQYIKDLIEENKQLKEQLQVNKKARKEAIEYINATEYSDIVGLNKNGIKEFWFVKDILKILDIDKGE